MPGDSAIAWTEKTWNIAVVGCDEVQPECDNCYARDWHNKWHRVREAKQLALEQAQWADESTYDAAEIGLRREARDKIPVQYSAPFSPARRMRDVLGDAAYQQRLQWPLRIKAPNRIFVNSMTDLFHSVADDEDIREVFAVMRAAHWHTFQVLTKRYGRLRYLGPQLDWPPNVHMGVSVGLNRNLPVGDGLAVGAAAAQVRFLSLEPLLGDLIDLTPEYLRTRRIDWVITGAESGTGLQGTGTRQRPIVPLDEAWVRRIRDACVTAQVPFFYKQRVDTHGHKIQLPPLDGVVWNQYPQEVAHAP